MCKWVIKHIFFNFPVPVLAPGVDYKFRISALHKNYEGPVVEKEAKTEGIQFLYDKWFYKCSSLILLPFTLMAGTDEEKERKVFIYAFTI